MFSKELQILDRNTVQFMIDEMEAENKELRRKVDKLESDKKILRDELAKLQKQRNM